MAPKPFCDETSQRCEAKKIEGKRRSQLHCKATRSAICTAGAALAVRKIVEKLLSMIMKGEASSQCPFFVFAGLDESSEGDSRRGHGLA